MLTYFTSNVSKSSVFFWLQNNSQRETIICQNATREIIFRNWLYCNCHTFQKLKINNHLMEHFDFDNG